MSFQSYIDNIKEKTGKTPDQFLKLARERGLLEAGVKAGQIVDWLKKDFQLGHGHAMAIVATLKEAMQPRKEQQDRVAAHFAGTKAKWRKSWEDLVNKISRFGKDVSVSPTDSYISFLRNGRKFGIVQVTSNRMDIGVKLPGEAPKGRLQASGKWNAMVTHRIAITAPSEIDKQVMDWLKDAFLSV